LCVFCGASSGSRSVYSDAAKALGDELIRREVGLVYGGGSVGLMGIVSNAVHTQGGKVLGVIPEELAPREVSGESPGEVILTSSMHARKALMFENSDGFIGLPGGLGTLEELFEVITWQQLGYHEKPIGLLNIEGFYDSLLGFLDHLVREGFVRESARRIVLVASTPAELIDQMEGYKAPESLISMARKESKGQAL